MCVVYKKTMVDDADWVMSLFKTGVPVNKSLSISIFPLVPFLFSLSPAPIKVGGGGGEEEKQFCTKE